MSNENPQDPRPVPPSRTRTDQRDGFGGFSDQPDPESGTPEKKDD